MRTLESGRLVVNINGTSICLPRGFSSWKEFYTYWSFHWPRTCRIKGCGKEAEVGAHVWVQWENDVFLIPMCRSHNKRNGLFPVNEGTRAVPVIKERTTGSFGTCYTR